MKTANNIWNFFATVALMFGVNGCSDLEDIGYDTVSRSDIPEKTLKEVYTQLNAFTNLSNTFALLEHPSDEMQYPRNYDWGDDRLWQRLHTHEWRGIDNDIVGAWDDLNRGQALANEVIDDSRATKRQIAEAQFLRAYNLYYLVDFFGQVIFKDLSNPKSLPKILKRTEATNQIINDLISAIPDLEVATALNTDKATKESAKFLLTKVLLNKAVFMQNPQKPSSPFVFSPVDMDAVIKNADEIINSGKYSFASNYFDNFHWENTIKSTELIFVIKNEAGKSLDDGSSVRAFYLNSLNFNQTPSGWNGFATLADFYNSFEIQDKRRGDEIADLTNLSGLRAGFLIGQQYGPGGIALKSRYGVPLIFTPEIDFSSYPKEEGGIRVIKYLPDLNNLNSPGNDFVFFRYADVWLMKAEALFRKGNVNESLIMINTLRNIRGATSLNALNEADILAERGRELYWEGWRRNDQIRFGTFLKPVQNRATISPAYRVVFPIPQKVLDVTPNLTQNFGYPIY
jgi:starch-binding outer membrane protein, SusD/RagB family